jgi:hypothetical protein
LPIFWVHCGYFEYKNFSGKFCRAEIMMLDVGKAN